MRDMTFHIDLEALVRNRLVPQQALDIILCHLVKRRLQADSNTIKIPHYHFKICSLTKSFRKQTRIIIISPRGSALSRLRSQYAKKPKNPV
jgi:hypothetical protein